MSHTDTLDIKAAASRFVETIGSSQTLDHLPIQEASLPTTLDSEVMSSVLPSKPSTEPTVVRLEDVDIPVPALQKENPDINRFSAGFIILHQHPVVSSKQQALLIQRGCDGSWGETWEGPGGGYAPDEDVTIKHTALRETQEEAGVVVPLKAIFPLVYRTTFEHKGLRMAYYTFVAQLDEEVPVTLSHEHLAWGFFDEEYVGNFGPFNNEKSRRQQFVMLEDKKRILCHIFKNRESLKNGVKDGIMPVNAK